jgi:hypothetical protein
LGDGQLLADLAPVVAAVAAAVVGQDWLDAHTAGGEPGLGSAKEPGRGLTGLIRVNLGIGEARVVIDRGMMNPWPCRGL